MGLLGMLGIKKRAPMGGAPDDEIDYLKRMRDAWGLGGDNADPAPQMQPERKFLGMTGNDMADWGQTFAQAGAMFDGNWGDAAQIANNRAMMNVKLDPNAKFNEWRKQYDYERQNPKPSNNDTVADLNWYKGLSEDDKKLFDQMKPVVVQTADGPKIVPRSTIGVPPPPPVGSVVPQSEWDSAQDFTGGASVPSGSPVSGNGGFQPPSQVITTAQFQQEIRRRGPAGASEWLRANNISIRN